MREVPDDFQRLKMRRNLKRYATTARLTADAKFDSELSDWCGEECLLGRSLHENESNNVNVILK
jgi:hypothetical protein